MTVGASDNSIVCNSCSRRFKWKPEWAGKQARCTCGQLIIVAEGSSPPTQKLIELVDVPARKSAPAPNTSPTSSHANSQPRAEPAAHNFSPENLRDFQLPLILIAAGIVVEVIAACLREPSGSGGFSTAFLDVLTNLLINAAVMLLAVLIATRVRGIQLGSFRSAILKLAAVSIAPAALITVLGPLIGVVPLLGPLGGLAVDFCLFFALLGYFFDLNQEDTWYCLAVMFVVALATHFGKPWLPQWL
jgi:hypothetical protein